VRRRRRGFRRSLLALLAAGLLALSFVPLAGSAPRGPGGDSNVGGGFGSCLLGLCCPTSWTLYAYLHAYGATWLCTPSGWVQVT
jgi:hypothetical protein